MHIFLVSNISTRNSKIRFKILLWIYIKVIFGISVTKQFLNQIDAASEYVVLYIASGKLVILSYKR